VKEIGGNLVYLSLKCRFTYACADEEELQGKPRQEVRIIDILGEDPGKPLLYQDTLLILILHQTPDKILGHSTSCPDEDATPALDS